SALDDHNITFFKSLRPALDDVDVRALSVDLQQHRAIDPPTGEDRVERREFYANEVGVRLRATVEKTRTRLRKGGASDENLRFSPLIGKRQEMILAAKFLDERLQRLLEHRQRFEQQKIGFRKRRVERRRAPRDTDVYDGFRTKPYG